MSVGETRQPGDGHDGYDYRPREPVEHMRDFHRDQRDLPSVNLSPPVMALAGEIDIDGVAHSHKLGFDFLKREYVFDVALEKSITLIDFDLKKKIDVPGNVCVELTGFFRTEDKGSSAEVTIDVDSALQTEINFKFLSVTFQKNDSGYSLDRFAACLVPSIGFTTEFVVSGAAKFRKP